MLSLFFGPMLLAVLLPASVRANQPEPKECAAPRLGSYLVIRQGQRGGSPLGGLQLETWSEDGSVRGRRFLRVGRRYSETRYEGRWQQVSTCGLTVTRDQQGSGSSVLLSDQGTPRFGISTKVGDVVTEQWLPQPAGDCKPSAMDGTVLSRQMGMTFANGAWTPNAVIQRETWSAWQMAGLAVSSYDGAGEVAAYQGRFLQDDNCVGRIRQQDARGVNYVYAAVLRSDGTGYAYLQTQGDDLTVALLDRIAAEP